MNNRGKNVKIEGWILFIGGILFGVAQLVIVWLSNVPLEPSSFFYRTKRYFLPWAFANEVLTFSLLILSVGIMLLYKKLSQHSPITSIIGLINDLWF